jgi:hypothetical protein
LTRSSSWLILGVKHGTLMSRSLPIVCLALCLLLGVSVGWYFGYTRPLAENQRRLLKIDQTAREAFWGAQKDFEDAYSQTNAGFWEAAKVQDEYTAFLGLHVLRDLERGNVEEAKQHLASNIGSYYRMHRRDGNSNLLETIAWVAATNALLSNAICQKPK